jgi:NAD(P)-dependent dehydrogenase (short-subunit alcohol dehydrogenase family)
MAEGKVTLITGATRGLGRESARRLHELGHVVYLGARDANAGEAAAHELGVQCVQLDVTDDESVQRAAAEIDRREGRLDVLINNAGILRDKMSFNMDESEWDQVIDVHLKGHFATSRFAASYWRLKSKETGAPVNAKIVNTASESGLYGNAGQANYAAAKAGIASMTIVMARELERIGVRVNAICPVARTRLTEQVAGDFMNPKEGEFDKFAPENISAVVCWLASDLADGVTGQVVKVMGGQVQLVRGWRPITEATDDKPWTIESIDAVASSTLFAHSDKGTPPFMPNVGDN